MELRDSTLFISSREEDEEEDDNEEATAACGDEVEPFPPLDEPWLSERLPRDSSRRAVSRQSSLSLLRCRIDKRLRMTQPRV